MAWKGDNSVSW